MTRRMLTRPDGSLLNTCTSDAIIQILRFLKRAYWPFAWDTSQGLAADSRGLGIGGGFAGAAQVSAGLVLLMPSTYHQAVEPTCSRAHQTYPAHTVLSLNSSGVYAVIKFSTSVSA